MQAPFVTDDSLAPQMAKYYGVRPPKLIEENIFTEPFKIERNQKPTKSLLLNTFVLENGKINCERNTGIIKTKFGLDILEVDIA